MSSISSTMPPLFQRRIARDWAIVLAYGAAWVLGYYISTFYWFLPAGLRFASLWCLPRRLWPWLAVVEFLAINVTVSQGSGYLTWSGAALGIVGPWVVHASVVALMAPPRELLVPDTPLRMGRLMLAMLASALATAVLLSLMNSLESPTPVVDPLVDIVSYAIGDYIAMLFVVPIWLHLRFRDSSPTPSLLRDMVLYFVPLLVAILVFPVTRRNATEYVAVLAVVPMVFMVFRHGWRGGGWALALTSIAVYVLGEWFDAGLPRPLMQIFLAIVGAVSLMLGAAVSALRHARDALEVQNSVLADQTLELRALGQRLVRAQEEEQRRIAHDLHGELEQGITALGTRLGLLARTSLEPSQMAAVDELRGMTQNVQTSVRDVLMRLRPEVLDRFGLERALRDGPVNDLLVDAQVRSEVTIRGRLALLDSDTQGALYRICQEAATDCVRRVHGKWLKIALEVSEPEPARIDVQLRIDYTAPPDASSVTRGAPRMLPGTRDRVLALGGDYACGRENGGIVHRVRLMLEGMKLPGLETAKTP